MAINYLKCVKSKSNKPISVDEKISKKSYLHPSVKGVFLQEDWKSISSSIVRFSYSSHTFKWHEEG